MSEKQFFLKHKDLFLDIFKKQVWINNIPVKLRRLEFQLLLFLMKHSERVIPRSYLLEKVWGYKSNFVKTNTIETHIYTLRKKLKEARDTKLITVSRVGYMLQ